MTEEEKKAIEMLEYIGIRNTLMGCTFENRDYLARILLNLIRKKDTEINSLKERIQKQEKSREHLKKQLKGEIAVKDTEINKLKEEIESLKNTIEMKKDIIKDYKDQLTEELENRDRWD